MQDARYVPDTTFVLHEVEEEVKAFHLFHHSEKLAIAFGLISTAQESAGCCDCHTSTKFLAKLNVHLILLVRDANPHS